MSSNQGSARDEKPVSLSGLLATLAPTALIAGIYLLVFLLLRRSQKRYYAPRTYLGSLRERNRTTALPTGWFNWLRPFFAMPETYALQHQSLDAYLFLRFLRMTIIIMFVGACITWPVLFPLNATGGGTKQQLDILSMSNIDRSTRSGKNRYYAHCLTGWIFYGFVLFLVTRESIFYINLRQAWLLSPSFANRLSARTVLFTAVPETYLDERKLAKVFGAGVRNVWIVGDSEKVDDLVEERDKVAFKLEKAEVKLLKAANKARMKSSKKGGAQAAVDPEEQDEMADPSIRWVPSKKRPSHRLGKFGLYGKKVDTIQWSRDRLEKLVPETTAAQIAYRHGENKRLGSVLIEFIHQSDAQTAYQTLSHHQALHMSPRYIGIHPDEVIWKSLSVSWWQRIIRRYVVIAFIAALVIFWAIPVAGVGFISNIGYMEQFSWLSWLKKIPSVIMGVVTGLLPSVLLSVLMSLVPIIMRLCARLSGEPSLSRVELFTQNSYFVFQVVQVFLITTISSAASSVLYQLIHDPTGILNLLAENLPTASNFYISYFIVQGLTVASGVLSQVVGFLLFKLLYRFTASTPRSMYKKWSNLSAISWGSTLPVFTCIAVIGITYSCIAPLVLGFATIGMSFFYIAYKYNILFVTETQIDTKGLIYPRALQQLLTGVYLSELCLIGLFAIATAIGPLILMIIFFVFTVLFHLALNSALDPLLYNLPKSLEIEEEALLSATTTPSPRHDLKDGQGASTTVHEEKGSPATSTKEPNFLIKFLRPHIYASYERMRHLVPLDSVDYADYDDAILHNAYFPPSVKSDAPLLWIPRDAAGLSRHEIWESSKVVPITDEGCLLDDKGKLIWDRDAARPPLWSEGYDF